VEIPIEQVTGQGTRLSDKPPWETYSSELALNMSPELEAAVEEYSKHRYDDDQTSNQNKEELARQKEANREISKEYQWLTEEEYKDQDPRIGRLLSYADLINMLRKVGIRCFYRDHVHSDKAVLWVAHQGKEQIAAWVQINGLMPEYEFVNFDDHGIVTNTRRRGWRTVLLQMILKGFITEELVTKTFGPAQGPASKRYNSLLYAVRNRQVNVV
jgi:hypothetical protein